MKKDLKRDKDGENHGFKSDHTDLIVRNYICIYIFGLEHFFFTITTYLILDLLLLTIISIPKDF